MKIFKMLFEGLQKYPLLTDGERKIVAVHEAGHAVVASILPHAHQPDRAVLRKRGPVPGEVRCDIGTVLTEKQLTSEIAVRLAGRAAEELVLEEKTVGAAEDIEVATALATKMVAVYGMARAGVRSYVDLDMPLPPCLDEEITLRIDEAYAMALRTLESHRSALEQVASQLECSGTITGEEIRAILVSNSG